MREFRKIEKQLKKLAKKINAPVTGFPTFGFSRQDATHILK